MTGPRIVSLFSGVRGLDLAVEAVTGGRVVAHCETDAGASAVLARHCPDVPNLRDATTVDWAPWVGRVDAVCAGFSCFPAGTPVAVKDGMRAIETVREGDLVLTHKGRWRRVVATMRREDAPLLSVKSLGEPGIACTPEHPFFAKCGRGAKPEWVKAQDLTPQHYVAVASDDPGTNEQVEGAAFWYMVGRWLGDGFIADYPRVGRKASRMRKALICCDKPEADGLASRIAAAGYHATPAEMRTTITFHISNAELVEFLRPFGRGAAHKLVPEFVFSRSRAELRELWCGWMDADGWRTDRFEQATTVSEQLARGMQRVGEAVFSHRIALYHHQVPPTTVIEGRVVNQLPQWQLRRSSTRPHGPADDSGLMWCQVRSVTPLDGRSEVFNFEVEEDNSYIAGRHVVHNCQDLSYAGRGEGIRDSVVVPAGIAFCGCDWADHNVETCEAASPSGAVPLRLFDDGWTDEAAQAVAELNERDRGDPNGPPPERTIEGTRSGVTWGATIRAVRALRPRVVFLENVRAILVRGLTRVASDLAAAGYDLRWACVRASDVGAPHRRDRWFAVAYPQGERGPVVSTGDGRGASVVGTVAGAGGGVGAGDSPAGVRVVGRGAGPQREAAAYPDDGRPAAAGCAHEGRQPDTASRGRAAAADSGCGGEQRRGGPGLVARPPGGAEGTAQQRQRVRDAAGDRSAAPAAADGAGPQGHGRPVGGAGQQPAAASDRPAVADSADVGQQRGRRTRRRGSGPAHDGGTAWGEFAPAIHRWEHITGQPAPPPTDDRGRLNPDFVEWMVGLEVGYTDVGISRSQRLRCLGNIAVPMQAAAAYRLLLDGMRQEVAA